jgi:hypothetical protein
MILKNESINCIPVLITLQKDFVSSVSVDLSNSGGIIQKSREELSSLTRPETPAGELTPLTTRREWKQDCLDSHNFFRDKYIDNLTGEKLGLLQWDVKLAQSAQQWADEVAPRILNRDISEIDHSGTAYGENMSGTSFDWKHDLTCSPGILRFHKEADLYYANLKAWRKNPTVFNVKGRFSYGRAYHFTQLMWPSTTKVGCGFAFSIDETIEDEKKKKKKKIEICHYYDR